MRFDEIMKELQRLADPSVAEGMKRFGVPTGNALGISAPNLRLLAKRIGKDQGISLKLWTTGIMEAQALAALVGEPEVVTKRQMNLWAREFDAWNVCDACCGVLFVHTRYAMELAFTWSGDHREFVKRGGFVLMAAMAIHQKALKDHEFVPMLRAIHAQSNDERAFVKKAVNWALRQIGKRNMKLNALAIKTARRIHSIDSPAARWIASDALRELRSPAVSRRLRTKLERSKRR